MTTSRRRQWLVVLGALLAAMPLWCWRGSRDTKNAVVTARLTLLTLDRDDLSCGLQRAIGRLRCEFQDSGQPWPAPPDPADRLAPYLTVTRQMFLIPALFEQPALAARYAQEPPVGTPRDHLRRFTVTCQLRLIDKIDRVKVRWERSGAWGEGTDAWVAVPESCRLDEGS